MVGGESSPPIEFRLGSAFVPLMLSASWMAESATSVGSLAFLGLFAMFSPTPLTCTHPAVLAKPQARSRIHNPPRTAKRARRQPVRIHPRRILWVERCERNGRD